MCLLKTYQTNETFPPHYSIVQSESRNSSGFRFCRLWLCGASESSLDLWSGRRSERDSRGLARRRRAQTKPQGGGAKVIGSERSDLSSVSAVGGQGGAAGVKWRTADSGKKILRCGFKSARRCLHILWLSFSAHKTQQRPKLFQNTMKVLLRATTLSVAFFFFFFH